MILGLDNAGKTTIVKRLLKQDVKQVSPTMGFQINTFNHNGFTLNIWDVGGQTSLRPFWYNYFERTDSIIWVVDANSIERLLENFQEFNKILQEDRLVGANLLILVNKIDLLDNDNDKVGNVVDLIARNLRLANITNHNWNILPCSAYTGHNIDAGLEWIVEEVKQRLYIL